MAMMPGVVPTMRKMKVRPARVVNTVIRAAASRAAGVRSAEAVTVVMAADARSAEVDRVTVKGAVAGSRAEDVRAVKEVRASVGIVKGRDAVDLLRAKSVRRFLRA